MLSHKTSENYIFHNWFKSGYLRKVASLIFPILFMLSIIFAQDLLKEFDVSIQVREKSISAQPNAVKVIVKSKVPNLRFESNKGIKKVEKIGEGEWKLTLYPGSQRFEIKANGYISYSERITFEKQKVYECKVSEKTDNIYRRVESDLYEVSFIFNVDNVYCSFNDLVPNLSIGNRVIFEIAEGEYTFNFTKDSYRPVSRTITVTSDKTININLERDISYREAYQSPGIAIITTSPSNAEIILNGQKYGYSPTNITGLLKGEHQLEIRMNKYHSDFSSFTINESEIKNISVVLKPKFGYLNITSHPDDCEVYLNNLWTGKTPIKNLEYESGTYQLVVKKNLYHDYVKDDIAISDGETQEFEFDLKPAFGTIRINSNPEQGAEILINGKAIGKTPYQNNKYPSGDYNIELRKQYFTTLRERISVSDGKTTNRTFLLQSTVGTLNTASNGAKLYINDKLVTQAHNNIKLKPGSYKLRAEKDKHYPQEKTINVYAGKIEKINFDLIPKQGSISIVVTPLEQQKGSEIFIDGTSYGQAPFVQKLLIGRYTVKVRINGKTYTKSVTVKENQDIPLNFNIDNLQATAPIIKKKTKLTRDSITVTDIDGNVYKTVKIGNQVWMAENLRVTRYRNGKAIPNVTTKSKWKKLKKGAYCSYKNNDSNIGTYGLLYNWYAVNDSRNLAPAGWHVPTDEEWKQLEMYLGMSQTETNDTGWRGTDEGGKLKEIGTTHWKSPNTGATNLSGFTAVPGGCRTYDGTFYSIGTSAYFWSATEIDSYSAWGTAAY